ncbi:MAG TPA: ATPase [Alphaproteobacteria bacterium]|nr:ATPase [Alphaproteobacteria bacterium]HBC52896.1 ATPase [Alphaproteobacteria bacterium]HBF98853.1 ATPase [Alphaproteobacteria bacterium]
MAATGGTHILVVGNEKGGSGKTTTAMHIAVAVMRAGHKVATIDLDPRQRSLTRYAENRRHWAEMKELAIPHSTHRLIKLSDRESVTARKQDEEARLARCIAELGQSHDFIIIDCPGSDSALSRAAHSYADTLVTPLNDSFIDFDLLAQIDPETFAVDGPSLYSELVWDSRKSRALRDRGTIDWVVIRNRMSSLNARNKERVGEVLQTLSRQVGFRLGAGFGERVIYRELFPSGLTLLDLRDEDVDITFSMSHVAALQELRDIIAFLRLPQLVLPFDASGKAVAGGMH